MDWASLGTGIAVVLTLMVYSYLVGDNVVFRVAEHLLVGVSIGWATLQILFGLLIPAVETVRREASSGSPTIGTVLTYVIPLVLGALLLGRFSRATRALTNLIIALVIGTVAALALAGAVLGTLIPQVGQTMINLRGGPGASGADIIGNIVLVAGALLSLAYFQFSIMQKTEETATAPSPVLVVRQLGRWSIMLAFGAVFGAVFLTYFAALVDRLVFLFSLGG
jgi:hypothetical protein